MLKFSAHFGAPLAIRYPREGKRIFKTQSEIVYGKWEKLKEGSSDFAIIACGERAVTIALAASQSLKEQLIDVSVINARFVKPLDTQMLNELQEKYLITVEDNMLAGGLGSLVNSFYSCANKTIKNFAYDDYFIPQGSIDDLMSERGVCSAAIVEYIKNENR